MEMVAPGKAIVRWWQPDIRDSDGTNSWESVELAVNQTINLSPYFNKLLPGRILIFNYDEGVEP